MHSKKTKLKESIGNCLIVPKYLFFNADYTGLTNEEIVLLSLISWHSFKERGVCELSTSNFMELLGWSKPTIFKYLKILEEKGYIKTNTIERIRRKIFIDEDFLKEFEEFKINKKPFYKVPYKWLREYKMQPLHCFIIAQVLMIFYSERNFSEEGKLRVIQPSNEYFAKFFKVSKPTVQLAINEAEENGILTINTHFDRSPDGTKLIKVRYITPKQTTEGEKRKTRQEEFLEYSKGTVGTLSDCEVYDSSKNIPPTEEEEKAFDQVRNEQSTPTEKEKLADKFRNEIANFSPKEQEEILEILETKTINGHRIVEGWHNGRNSPVLTPPQRYALSLL